MNESYPTIVTLDKNESLPKTKNRGHEWTILVEHTKAKSES